MRELLLLLFAIILALPYQLFAGTYSGGAGTSGDPYKIATTADLIELSKTSTDWASGKYFIQTAYISFDDNEQLVDWDNDGTANWDTEDQLGFSPIGFSTNFSGNYDGQSYTITNLFINRSASSLIGLFGFIKGATISNIGLLNVNITGQSYAGGLAGRSETTGSTINNCFTTGTVTASSDYIGGLIGYSAYTNITNSYSTCNVSGNLCVGGFAGNNVTSTASIKYSYSTGSVTGNTAVGGFVGGNSTFSTVSNCYSLGNVTRSSGTDVNIGGFVGDNYYGSITNGFSIGKVIYGSTTQTNKGFVGSLNAGTTTNCFWDTDVSGSSTSEGTATGKTTSQMKTEATFTGASWDFGSDETDWVMSSNITFIKYPTLRWTGGYAVSPTDYQIAILPNLVWIAENSARWEGADYTQTSNINMWTSPSWDGSKGWTPIGNSTTNFTGSYNGQNYKISNLYINRSNYLNIGLFGFIQGDNTTTEVQNLGLINVNIVGNSQVGALAGIAKSYCTIIKCYSTGNVNGKNFVGGLVGNNESFSVINNSYTKCNIIGEDYIGGLVGKNDFDAEINNSFSTGNVSGENYVGGFIGWNLGSSVIINCYSTGKVTRRSGSSSNFGGFCGNNTNSKIQYCYSTGAVYMSAGTIWNISGIKNKGFVGAVVLTCTFTNNFFDSETSEQTDDSPEPTADYTASDKTTAQMKTEATFTNWDFTPTPHDWNILSVSNISYPYIQGITYDTPGASPEVNPIPGIASGCTNPTAGGTIATVQTICYNETPDAFTSSSLPTGYNGTLEYKWQLSTTNSTSGFSDIASSNSATYTSGALTQTTWFKRLARVDCSAEWTGAVSSNVIEMTITPTEVYVDASYNSNTSGWGVTHFSDLSLALSGVCVGGTVSIAPVSKTTYSGNVSFNGLTVVLGNYDFELTGNITSGLIRTTDNGKLVMKNLTPGTTKIFPITDGSNDFTITINIPTANNQDIKMNIISKQVSRTMTSKFVQIDGEQNLNATMTMRVDKSSIAPKTISSTSNLRYFSTTKNRYVPFDGNKSSLEEFDDYYIISATGVNEF